MDVGHVAEMKTGQLEDAQPICIPPPPTGFNDEVKTSRNNFQAQRQN